MISTSEATALRSIVLSIMSRIRLSSSTGISGVSTISIERREFEMNDFKAGSLSGNFFVEPSVPGTTSTTIGTRYEFQKFHRNRKMAVWIKGFEKQGSRYKFQ